MESKTVVRLSNATVYHSDDPYVTLSPKNLEEDGEKILEGINMEVRKGEFVYLIGKVGSGKSSLLRVLYADLPLLEGEGEVAGFNLRELKRRDIPFLRRKLGIVFQNLQVLSDRDVYSNLEYTLRATGWKVKEDIETRITEVLSLVNLEAHTKRMPFELSGGERQRLVIARALLNSPEIILADEPTGNLDPVNAEEIAELFHRIADSGTAVIMSTHNTSIVEQFPARTFMFSSGTVREYSPEELFKN